MKKNVLALGKVSQITLGIFGSSFEFTMAGTRPQVDTTPAPKSEDDKKKESSCTIL